MVKYSTLYFIFKICSGAYKNARMKIWFEIKWRVVRTYNLIRHGLNQNATITKHKDSPLEVCSFTSFHMVSLCNAVYGDTCYMLYERNQNLITSTEDYDMTLCRAFEDDMLQFSVWRCMLHALKTMRETRTSIRQLMIMTWQYVWLSKITHTGSWIWETLFIIKKWPFWISQNRQSD